MSTSLQAADSNDLGYSDTPFLPGGKWRVHDSRRPQPRVVAPGVTFSHLAPPPADAVVLFDGHDLSKWKGGDGDAKWKVENGYMEVVASSSIQTRDEFEDFQLHLEFASPSKVENSSQGRGNSGVIVFGRYEIQVLDSHNNPTYADGQTGALYGQYPPRVNVSRPPGVWQTYDIIFETARWDKDGKLVKPANATILHNGAVLHHKQDFIGFVRHADVARYSEPHPPSGPIVLQDHGNPVRYRNIWIRPLGDYDKR